MSEPSPLLPDDLRSATWQRLRDHMTARLQTLREQNDSGEADITAKRRGRIAELKDLLALDPKSQHSHRRPSSGPPEV